nr:immunoglobulin light chain junction region [Macaca mulatta]
CQQESTGPTF